MKFLVGRSPLTTLAGCIVAVLTGIHQMSETGAHNWQDYLLPAAIALFGRLAADDGGKRSKPPLPFPAPDETGLPTPEAPSTFLRRGKMQRQGRGRNGRFAPSLG